jgi:type II secretory pathway pseudopilin PulG
MKPPPPSPYGRRSAFSLVEVVVALGIFSFVIVGIFGLLPAALKLREDSSQDSHAVLVAEELVAAVRNADSIRNVTLRDGPGLKPGNNVYPGADLTAGNLVIGYPSQTTVPFGLWHSSRGNDPDGLWTSGRLPSWAVENGIATLARISALELTPSVYQITIEVRSPASIPLENSRPVTFITRAYAEPAP